MTNEPNELPETIKCGKKGCECDIPVIDCYFINKPEVPQIGVKCPVCGKVSTISKAKSIAYAAEYAQIQEDIDTALGYKGSSIEDMDEFGDRVMRALDAFGYKGSKFAQAKKSIREMVDNVPSYQTFQGLYTLLISMKIQPNHAMMAAQRVFATEQPQMPDMGMQQIGMNQPGLPMQPQMPYQQPIGQPQMPYQQQMPPPAYPYPQQMPPQMLYQQPQPAPPPATDDDGITIIEKIGDEGQVIERVIKQPKPADAPTDGTAPPANMAEQLKDVIDVMNEAGMIRSAEQETQPTIEEIVEHIAPLLERPEPDDKYDKISGEISALKDLIARNEQDKMAARFDSIEARINNTGKAGMSDAQHSDVIRKDIETARIDALSTTLDRVVKPIIDMQATQAKFQTMMMVRQVEQQDGAKPGTYAQMFAPTTVPDEDVQEDLGKWRSRAGRSGATA